MGRLSLQILSSWKSAGELLVLRHQLLPRRAGGDVQDRRGFLLDAAAPRPQAAVANNWVRGFAGSSDLDF